VIRPYTTMLVVFKPVLSIENWGTLKKLSSSRTLQFLGVDGLRLKCHGHIELDQNWVFPKVDALPHSNSRLRSPASMLANIWGVPKIGVPPNHPF
jgi:hypothetical protein